MSSHTDTQTTWGSLRVSYEDDGRRIATLLCKHCGRSREVVLEPSQNPFELRPFHEAYCVVLRRGDTPQTPEAPPAPTKSRLGRAWDALRGRG